MSNQEHTFIVTVGGCTAEQAEQVMRERICHEEEYGFDYDLGFSAKRLTDQSVIDTPEAPARIEEWPDGDDEHLRAYEWRDRDGRPWVYSRTHGRWYNFSSTAISKLVTDEPKFGPWTRVTDA